MEPAACSWSIRVLEVLPGGMRLGLRARVHARSVVNFQSSVEVHTSRLCRSKRTARFVVKASSMESNKCESKSVRSPLEPQTQAGKFLSAILQNQPNLFLAAATELLNELASVRDGALARQDRSLGSSESCLHGRIAEMKEVECQVAIEEVMYMLVVRNFLQIKVPMVPRLSDCSTANGAINIWPTKDKELELIHQPEILALIKEHLSNILGREVRYGYIANWSTAKISRLQLGRLYAASIMYGYFLMEASSRHRLEHKIARTDEDYPLDRTLCVPHLEGQLSHLKKDLVVLGRPFDPMSSLPSGLSMSARPKDLKSYVMRLDPKAVQLCARLRSEAAANIIESHSLAIFLNGDMNDLERDEMISVTISGFKRLMLDAVAFGTFLWDAEGFVDSIYRLRRNHTEPGQ